MQSRQALSAAREQGLDLVMVSPTAQPPVCKIIDYGKHKYLEGKLGKDKKSKQQEVKGIKISPRIAEHDLLTGVTKARRFLEEGDKVKVTCVFKAREMHMAGATVLRGPLGFGSSSRLHSAKILRLSEDLPMVIEIVDSPERIDAFLPALDAMMGSGLVTLEKVQVLQYGAPRPPPGR